MPIRTVRDVAMVFTDADTAPAAALLDLVSASRRSGRSPGSLALLASRGDVVAFRDPGGSWWFDRVALDERFGVRSLRIELDEPFW
jgi:hypothetical protein